MASKEFLNYLALYQNILKHKLAYGTNQSPELLSNNPINTELGLKLYLNGQINLPENSPLIDGIIIGKLIHPYAMIGMPSLKGELTYEFWETKFEYLIIVRLKLAKSKEESEAILSLIKKNQLPHNIKPAKENFRVIIREMTTSHFELLFEQYDNFNELKKEKWKINEDYLSELILNYFSQKPHHKN